MHVYPSITSVVVTYGGGLPGGAAAAAAAGAAGVVPLLAAGAPADEPPWTRSFPSNSAARARNSDFWGGINGAGGAVSTNVGGVFAAESERDRGKREGGKRDFHGFTSKQSLCDPPRASINALDEIATANEREEENAHAHACENGFMTKKKKKR